MDSWKWNNCFTCCFKPYTSHSIIPGITHPFSTPSTVFQDQQLFPVLCRLGNFKFQIEFPGSEQTRLTGWFSDDLLAVASEEKTPTGIIIYLECDATPSASLQSVHCKQTNPALCNDEACFFCCLKKTNIDTTVFWFLSNWPIYFFSTDYCRLGMSFQGTFKACWCKSLTCQMTFCHPNKALTE